MSTGTEEASAVDDWPAFALQFTYNPPACDFSPEVEFESDEVVVYETQADAMSGRWLSAERGSYVSVDEMR